MSSREDSTTKTVKELFLKGTVPTQRETIRVSMTVDEASGLVWREGCVGPKVQRGFFDRLAGRLDPLH